MTDPEPEAQPQPAASRGRPRLSRGARELAETLLLALVIYLGVQTLVPPYAVEGRSMDPTLQDGERLLVNRSVYAHFDANKLWNLLPGEDRAEPAVVYPFHPPERGDIVVFQPPVASDRPYIKRVIGLPGDRVSVAEGRVWINGEPLTEPYLEGARTACDGRHCDVTVSEGEVYLLGDNRRNSSDSRVFGPVSLDDIVGKAWLANWPPEAFGFIPHVDYDEQQP
jgi:signal peptidase I